MSLFIRLTTVLFCILASPLFASPEPVGTESTPPGYKIAESEVFALFFETQLSESPRIYDAPNSSSCLPSVSPLEVRWVEPSAGVNENTGLLIILYGINSGNDCNRVFFTYDPNWTDDYNLITATVYYRNISFFSPYDYGKYQVVDILRGTGAVLEQYPQLDRRRLYLMGGSGGGHAALQVMQMTPQIWSEVHINRAITRITLRTDVLENGYEEDPSSGWNVNMGFPSVQSSYSDEVWRRYQAERSLRSPQNHARVAGVYAPAPTEAIPPIYMMHGTADPTVDYQHFLDYRAAIEEFAGLPITELSADTWQLGNWRFLAVVGGTHTFPVNVQVNERLPEAFTRIKGQVPSFAIDYTLPPQHGYTYRLHGTDLPSVRVDTIDLEADPTAWMLD